MSSLIKERKKAAKAKERLEKFKAKTLAKKEEVKQKKLLKSQKIDGLGPQDIEKITIALRQVWSWSYSRRLVIKRCLLPNGFSKCEKCKKKCPKVFVDHIVPVGSYDGELIERMWVPSMKMQGLCNECHRIKTKVDVEGIKVSKRGSDPDFW